MKRAISLCLSFAAFLALSIPTSVAAQPLLVDEKSMIDISDVAPENREMFIAECVQEHIENHTSMRPLGDDRYYTYTTETNYKTVSVSGFADNAYDDERGFYLDGDGNDGLVWIDSTDSSTASQEVTFTAPYKAITVTIKVGFTQGDTTGGTTGIIKMATDGPGYYNILVTRKIEVRQVLIYQTDTRTGETKLWDEMYFQEEIGTPIIQIVKTA